MMNWQPVGGVPLVPTQVGPAPDCWLSQPFLLRALRFPFQTDSYIECVNIVIHWNKLQPLQSQFQAKRQPFSKQKKHSALESIFGVSYFFLGGLICIKTYK